MSNQNNTFQQPSDYEGRKFWKTFFTIVGIGAAVAIVGTVCIGVIGGIAGSSDTTEITPTNDTDQTTQPPAPTLTTPPPPSNTQSSATLEEMVEIISAVPIDYGTDGYEVKLTNGDVLRIDDANDFPEYLVKDEINWRGQGLQQRVIDLREGEYAIQITPRGILYSFSCSQLTGRTYSGGGVFSKLPLDGQNIQFLTVIVRNLDSSRGATRVRADAVVEPGRYLCDINASGSWAVGSRRFDLP